MRTLALLFLGVVVGWAASGVDWSREAVGEESIIAAGRASGLLNATTDAKIATPEPAPQWNAVATNGPRRVFETRMEVDANGQHRPVTVSRMVNADGTIVPETPPGLIGRFLATAYGSPSGHGCYIVDTMTGKTWHVAPGIGRQVMTEALIESAVQPVTPTPTAAYGSTTYGAPPLTDRRAPESGQPMLQNEPRSNVIPTPKPELAEPEPDDAN